MKRGVKKNGRKYVETIYSPLMKSSSGEKIYDIFHASNSIL
ncbi:MAG: hypothetical protein PHF84_03255 [bacterium]|nr:hypothetical protein [bacterium]